MRRRLLVAGSCFCLVAAVFLLFAFTVQHAAQNRLLDYDSAYHGSVSKNIASGYGYATSYDQRRILNPDITTGSAVIVPFASYLRFHEREIQSPLIFSAGFNLMLLGALLLVLGHPLRSPTAFLAFSVSLMGFLLLWEPKWFTAFTADMPVILLLALAAGMLTLGGRGYFRTGSIFLGVFIALALKAKMTAMIGLAVILPALLFQLWREREAKLAWIRLIFIAGGFFIAFLPLKTIEQRAFSELSPVEQQAYHEEKRRFVLGHDSTGIKPLLEAPDKIRHLAKSVHISYQVLSANMHRYGWYSGLIPVFFILVFGVFLLELSRLLREGVSAPLLFSGMSLAFAAWYFLLNVSYAPKYPYTPIVFGVMALLLFVAKFRWGGVAAFFVLGLLAATLSPDIRKSHQQDYLVGDPVQQQYNADLRAVVAFLGETTFDAPLAGCGWHIAPRSVEYLLPGAGHFRDCFRVIGDSLELLEGRAAQYRWIGDPGFYALIDLPLALYSKQDMDLRKPLQRLCLEQPVFRNDHFLIMHCPGENIIARLALTEKQAGKYFSYSHNRGKQN